MLATRPYLDFFSYGTAWSPDGKTIAFSTVESKESIRSVLWAVSLGDGSVREIYSSPNQIGRPCWLPDGSGLLASIGNIYQSLGGQLWFISFPKGQARRLTNDLMDYQPILGPYPGRHDSSRHCGDKSVRSVDRAGW